MFILLIQTAVGPYWLHYTSEEDLITNLDIVLNGMKENRSLHFKNSAQQYSNFVANPNAVHVIRVFTDVNEFRLYMRGCYPHLGAGVPSSQKPPPQDDKKNTDIDPKDWLQNPDWWKEDGETSD
jgi:hypothetical protein